MNFLPIFCIFTLIVLLGSTLRVSAQAVRNAQDFTWGLGPHANTSRSNFFAYLASRAGLKLTGTELGLVWLSIVAVSTAVVIASGAEIPLVIGVLVTSLLLPAAFIWFSGRGNSAELEHQFGEAMALIAADVRSGATVGMALNSVLTTCVDPLKTHFELVSARVENGTPLGDALTEMAKTTGSVDVQILATAVRVQESHGGSIASLIDQIGETIADRQELRKLIKARSASMTMTVRIVTGAVALFVVVGAVALEQGRDFYSRPIGLVAIAIIASMLVLANVIAAKLRDSVM